LGFFSLGALPNPTSFSWGSRVKGPRMRLLASNIVVKARLLGRDGTTAIRSAGWWRWPFADTRLPSRPRRLGKEGLAALKGLDRNRSEAVRVISPLVECRAVTEPEW